MKSLLVMLGMVFALVSCGDDSSGDSNAANRAIVEKQIKTDFDGTISGLTVIEKRGYEVATFTRTDTRDISTDTRAAKPNITAWYKIADNNATLKQYAEDLDTTMPTALKTAFDATPKYSVVADWTVTEVEIDVQNQDTNETRVYEIELVNVANTNLEAELYYSFDAPIQLLYSKETLDDDDNDDDKVVIDQKLIDAVELLYPATATVLVVDAEMDDNQVEVEAIVTETGKTRVEVEILFTDTTYTTVASQEVESKTTYVNIAPPEILGVVTTWFIDNVAKVPNNPAPTDIATVTTITTYNTPTVGVVTYEVEIEYIGTDTKNYDVELMIKDFQVTDQDVEIDDVEVTFP